MEGELDWVWQTSQWNNGWEITRLSKRHNLKMQGAIQILNRINPKKSYQKIYSPINKMEGQKKNILKIATEKEYLFSRESQFKWVKLSSEISVHSVFKW